MPSATRANSFLAHTGRIVVRLGLWAIVVVALLLAALWLDHTRATELPTPTGPFAVGRTTAVWGDPALPELMAPEPGTKRELMVWIWYPASAQQPSSKSSDYLPPALRASVEKHGGVLLHYFLTRDLARVQTHSVEDAGLSPQMHPYPVVLMRGGLAALVASYTSLAEDLASHGYIVVGFDAPYRTTVVVLPDGTVIQRAAQNNADAVDGAAKVELATKLLHAWSSDMSFALDQLERLNVSDPSGRFQGRIDMQRIGAFGHSLGGAEALQFCHDDARCKVGIDVDGAPLGSVVQSGLNKPFLFLMGDSGHGSDSDPAIVQVKADVRSIYDRLPDGKRLHVVIRGAHHFLFSDDGALLKSPLVMRVLGALGLVHLDGARQIAVTAHCIDAFFDTYLKGQGTSPPGMASPLYPEVQIVP